MQISMPNLMMISFFIFCLFQFIISIIVGAIGLYAWIELKTFMKSTHRIEYVPLDTANVGPTKEPMRDQDLNEFEL